MFEAKTKIKKFISQHFSNQEIKDDEDIFEMGFVNSMFAMQLVYFIEQEFNITVKNEDLDFDNFRTVNAMVSFLESKKALLTGSSN